jgi:hypothetical protein
MTFMYDFYVRLLCTLCTYDFYVPMTFMYLRLLCTYDFYVPIYDFYVSLNPRLLSIIE